MLQSLKSWVTETSYGLYGGQRLLLRMPPRVGKSFLVSLLKEELGDSAVIVSGSLFTEENQGILRDEIEERLSEALTRTGSAQLLFDSYDQAVIRSQGGRLQSWLTSRLIDGNDAQDIGAFFTARCSTAVHKSGAGSPLMSRVVPISPPGLTDEDDLSQEMLEWFGPAPLLVNHLSSQGAVSPSGLVDRLEVDLSYLNDVRRSANDALVRGRISDTDSYASRSATYGLLTKDGPTSAFRRLETVLKKDPVVDPTWPDGWNSSVERFGQLIAGSAEYLWVDRYMFRDIEVLRKFLNAVSAKVHCQIKLLGSRSVNGRQISRAEVARLSMLPNVEIKFMTDEDYKVLHDRHLVVGVAGWVMPQVHAILQLQPVGSAVAVPTNGFGVAYSTVWRRSLAV
jgi:hypothetical protein